jgi:hypothetical protein
MKFRISFGDRNSILGYFYVYTLYVKTEKSAFLYVKRILFKLSCRVEILLGIPTKGGLRWTTAHS